MCVCVFTGFQRLKSSREHGACALRQTPAYLSRALSLALSFSRDSSEAAMVSSATSVIVVVLALSALQPRLVVQAFPGGAPVGACARIFPVGHGTSSQPLANSPYALNISALDDGYVPGETYMRK